MNQWLSREVVEEGRAIFSYSLNPDEWDALIKTFDDPPSKRELRRSERANVQARRPKWTDVNGKQ